MVDWNTPTETTDYDDVLDFLRARDEHCAKMDFTGDTNLPIGAVRISSSTGRHEIWNGSSWAQSAFFDDFDDHVNNATIHEPYHVGSIEMITYATADSGWLICDGSAVSRATYATLYAKIGDTFGAGNGSTTFNLPNLKGRSPIGVDSANTDIDAIGETRGSWNHSHSTPNHQHTIPTHSHAMPHTHQVGAHNHAVSGGHVHSVGGHYHSVNATGADIAIASSGAHVHTLNGYDTTFTGSTNTNQPVESANTSNPEAWGSAINTASHTHDNADFTGRVGLVTGGSNGDAAFNTGAAATFNTDNSTAFTSGAESTANTSGSGTLTSNSGEGSGTSGTNNGPVLALHFQIKF